MVGVLILLAILSLLLDRTGIGTAIYISAAAVLYAINEIRVNSQTQHKALAAIHATLEAILERQPPPAPPPAPEPEAYYVQQGDEATDPFTPQQIAEMLTRGLITGDTYVLPEGTTTWGKLSASPLAEHLPAAE